MMINHARSDHYATLGLLVFAAILSFSEQIAIAGNETRFTVVDSSPTSWVARGFSNYTVSPDIGWTFTVGSNFDNGISVNMSGTALPGTTVTSWGLNFAAPFNAQITPGFYPDFQRWPFQDADHPGLEFSSTGRLDNRASGFFEVFNATYGAGGELLSFSADFTHYGEENLNNWAVAEVRFNVPEPTTLSLLTFGGFVLTRRGRRSRMR